MTLDGFILALAIFGLRVLNYSVGTIRLLVVARGGRILGAVMAGLEAFIFAVVIAKVITDLNNAPNLIAYCGGAIVGSYVGMVLEARFITGFMIINAFLPTNGREVAGILREAGFGVTTTLGEGRDGAVTTLRSVVDKRDVSRFIKLLQGANPSAFIAVEEARGVRRGWLNHGHRTR